LGHLKALSESGFKSIQTYFPPVKTIFQSGAQKHRKVVEELSLSPALNSAVPHGMLTHPHIPVETQQTIFLYKPVHYS
jgi:hypothetical protein